MKVTEEIKKEAENKLKELPAIDKFIRWECTDGEIFQNKIAAICHQTVINMGAYNESK